MNLFGSILTYAAPSANYRGESAENRAVIQKISFGRFEYAIISPEAMRNALRESLAEMGFPCNRKRVHDQDQLAVRFKDYPDHTAYIDDFFMGWLVAASKNDRAKIASDLKKSGRNPDDFVYKRDSVLRMNMAVALEPYRHNSVFTQSPLDATPKDIKSVRNADSSQLLHRETAYTPFQYPFALNLKDCEPKKDWTQALIKGIGQLNGVAGNHARSYFEMAPASVLIRLTPQLVAGYDNYGFKVEDDNHLFPEVIEGLTRDKPDFPASEFFIGGKIVKDLDESAVKDLASRGATLDRNPQRLMETVGQNAFA
jgi:CRISPR-associated protein Cst2